MAERRKRGSSPATLLKEPGRDTRAYHDNEVVYSQGDPADAVFYLQSGMVKLAVASKRRRKKAVLGMLQKGDLFGEGCLGGELRRMSAATSIGPSTIIRVAKSVFRQRLDRDRAFSAIFVAYLLLQTARLKADLADHCLNFSDRRLARVLLNHWNLAQKSKGVAFPLRFTHAALAEIVGTTRARVSTFMNEFRKKGYIRYDGGLEIDPERLKAFLED